MKITICPALLLSIKLSRILIPMFVQYKDDYNHILRAQKDLEYLLMPRNAKLRSLFKKSHK